MKVPSELTHPFWSDSFDVECLERAKDLHNEIVRIFDRKFYRPDAISVDYLLTLRAPDSISVAIQSSSGNDEYDRYGEEILSIASKGIPPFSANAPNFVRLVVTLYPGMTSPWIVWKDSLLRGTFCSADLIRLNRILLPKAEALANAKSQLVIGRKSNSRASVVLESTGKPKLDDFVVKAFQAIEPFGETDGEYLPKQLHIAFKFHGGVSSQGLWENMNASLRNWLRAEGTKT